MCKAYLENYKSLENERLNLLDERDFIVADEAQANGAIRYDREQVQTTKTNDGMYNIHVRIQERTRYIDRRLKEIDKEMDNIKDSINSMSKAKYKRFLYKKYIEECSLEEAAIIAGFSVENAGQVHGYALNALKLHLDQENRKKLENLGKIT